MFKVRVPDDPKWVLKREAIWSDLEASDVYEYCREEAEEKAALYQWHMKGDLSPLVQRQKGTYTEGGLDLYNVMTHCPIVDLQDYLAFMREYANWLSECKLSLWEARAHDDRDERLISELFNFSLTCTDLLTVEIKKYFLTVLLPDDNSVSRFPFRLGKDNWLPQYCNVKSDFLENSFLFLNRYLFNDDDPSSHYKNYKHCAVLLPFIENNVDYFDESAFLFEGGFRGNYLLDVFANLRGYKTCFNEYEGALWHNAPDIEDALRRTFEGSIHAEKYNALNRYLDENKDSLIKYS